MNRLMMGLAAALTMGASMSAANATSLDFIQDPSPTSGDESCIESGAATGCYGDHASGATSANGSTVGQGNAFTPKIGVSYSGNLRTWTGNGYLGSGDNVNPGASGPACARRPP